MRPRARTPEMGRTKTQAYCLVAARSGKLYLNKQRALVMRQGVDVYVPVRIFGKQIVTQCEKAGWIMRIWNHGMERIVTTPAGDAELARPLRLSRPNSRLWQDYQREALR